MRPLNNRGILRDAGLLLAIQTACVQAAPLKSTSSRSIDLVVETTAHLNLDSLLSSSEDSNQGSSFMPQLRHRATEEESLVGEQGSSPKPAYVTLTLPGDAPAKTRYPEPGCDSCFGTIYRYEPGKPSYSTVSATGEGPYPTVSTKLPTCSTCDDGKIYLYEPQQPKGGFPKPPDATVRLADAAGPNAPKVTLPPVLPLDPRTVVYGDAPGFQKRFPTYYAGDGDSSATRTVVAQRHSHPEAKEPVVIVGEPISRDDVTQAINQDGPDTNKLRNKSIQGVNIDNKDLVEIPSVHPGGAPIVIRINAGNNNGNPDISAGNGISSRSRGGDGGKGGHSGAKSDSGGNDIDSQSLSRGGSSNSGGNGLSSDSHSHGGHSDSGGNDLANTNGGNDLNNDSTSEGGNSRGGSSQGASSTSEGGSSQGGSSHGGSSTSDGGSSSGGGGHGGDSQGGSSHGGSSSGGGGHGGDSTSHGSHSSNQSDNSVANNDRVPPPGPPPQPPQPPTGPPRSQPSELLTISLDEVNDLLGEVLK